MFNWMLADSWLLVTMIWTSWLVYHTCVYIYIYIYVCVYAMCVNVAIYSDTFILEKNHTHWVFRSSKYGDSDLVGKRIVVVDTI